MTIAWPAELPQRFLRPGNEESIPDGRQMTEVDRGPPLARPGSSALGRPFKAGWKMSGAQIDILDAFVAETLVQGALPFTVPAPRGDAEWLVMFAKGSLPSWRNIGGDRYEVSAVLWIMP